MRLKKLKPSQLRNLMVLSMLSIVIALPILSQPLGLSFAWNYPEVDMNEDIDIDIESNEANAYKLEMVDEYDSNNVGFNRSGNDSLDTELTTGSEESATADGATATESVTAPADATTETGETTTTETTQAEVIVPAYAPVNYTLYVNANQLNLRAGDNLEAAILVELKFGYKVTCIGEGTEWMQVVYEDKTGYVATQYTSREMVFTTGSEAMFITANQLNLRKSPTTDSEIITTLKLDNKVTCLGDGDGWSKVKDKNGDVGYVVTEYLTSEIPASLKAAASTASSSSTGNAPAVTVNSNPGTNSSAGTIVEYANSALGVPYRSGGASLSGFDCSGLTSWAYKQIGIGIPRSTSGYYNAGTGIDYANLQPGDILCMDTRKRDGKTSITHVGIYIGGGNMIHASSTKGQVVVQNVNQYLGYGVTLITVRRFQN